MAPSDAELARLAGPLRILRLEELAGAGLSRKALRHRVEQGRLQQLWPSTYLVGPDSPGPHSLAYGAAVSYTGATYVDQRWSCFLHGFHRAPELPIDILVVTGSRLKREGIRPHRCETLAPQDIGHIAQIPVTSAARAILGVADEASRTQVEALVADAHAAGVVTQAALEDVLGRAGRRRAATILRAVVEDARGGMTLSEAERILRRLLKAAGLPRPRVNYWIGRYCADFCWPDLMLIVEFDSWAHHGHRKGFRRDRRRNSHLVAQGWSVQPITAEMLTEHSYEVVRLITEAITRRQSA